jgi:oligopeptide/dipeptide ABC transporter ATP-binding protein
MPQPLFEVTNLRVAVFDPDRASAGLPGPTLDTGEELSPGWIEVIPPLSFSVARGESLAMVGESASGKSLSLMGPFGLLAPGAKVIGGLTRFGDVTIHPGGDLKTPQDRMSRKERKQQKKKVRVAGTVMDDAQDEEWARVMGTEIGFLFQNPIGAWMPVEVIGTQSGEALDHHLDLTTEEIDQRVFDALGEVKLPKSARMFNAFSAELSRGQAQRAMLAAALTKAPSLLIADEPLNGLDAPVAAAIMNLILDMRDKRDMALVFVTHDLAAVARVADRIMVVYSGIVIEEATAEDICHKPKHPYTSGLIGSIPGVSAGRLKHIEGEAPRLADTNRSQCVFLDRCEYAIDVCRASQPPLVKIGSTAVACHRATELDLPGVGSRAG